jgi:S-(hydroxymethyl)mycothiol dehydrogenase
MTVELSMIELFGRGGAIKPSWYGDCLPTRDFPMVIDAHLAGRIDLDRFVSETSASTTSRRRSARCSAGTSCASVVLL